MRFTFPAIISVFLSFPFVLGAPTLFKRENVDYFDPRKGGGSLLNQSGGPGLGEPLNVIISGKSSSGVLTASGFLNYVRAVGYSVECFGQHQGARQPANLGDGNGPRDEREVLREHFGIPGLGTCLESLVGGNHLRTYRQDGPSANSGALFLAVSQEKDLTDHHDIVPDGYNIGRDRFVNAAVGKKRFLWTEYTTTVQDVPGLLTLGSEGVNHGISQDGIVKLLTVTSKFKLF
ncbi:hypothetical protein DFP72DRAFT_988020 [Ephemerocybe angulata]|uniref:Uncharacterized protein n=1 Tax=Ephemerocybe angulata TaxID=980116 RepID=A0A8H6I987_9AGAR|nr:hypothetical protein DFP72DRAFT_988020 [Tulosesus angulatus]